MWNEFNQRKTEFSAGTLQNGNEPSGSIKGSTKVAVEWLPHLLRILAPRPAILAEVIRGFSQSLLVNALSAKNYDTTASFQILINSSFTQHPFTRRYVVLLNEREPLHKQ
jgi:hypothetical protein